MNPRRRIYLTQLAAGVCLALLTLNVDQALAVDGVPFDASILQRENGQDLEPVLKQITPYVNTVGTTCLDAQAWCTKTATGTKLAHWHLTDTDLSATQKDRADAYIEFHNELALPQNKDSQASVAKTCHSYALGYTHHLVGSASEPYTAVFDTDYTEVASLPDMAAGQLCAHQNNHTSIVVELQGTGCDRHIETIIQKFGYYGVYSSTAAASGYGNIVSIWK